MYLNLSGVFGLKPKNPKKNEKKKYFKYGREKWVPENILPSSAQAHTPAYLFLIIRRIVYHPPTHPE